MILNIRGTSGSGKSTLARTLMGLYDTRAKVFEHGRKRPIMYLCSKVLHPSLAVIGHYETDCGGTDTITSQDHTYDLVRRCASQGYNVLFEGLLLSAEFNRAAALARGYDLVVLQIDIPLEQCVASVEARRRAKYERLLAEGKRPKEPGPLNPKNTESKWRGTRRTVERLREAGIVCHTGDRDECLRLARHALDI